MDEILRIEKLNKNFTKKGIFLVNSYPYSFKDDNGFTVVIGEIFNNHNFPISDIKILVDFYSEISDEPIDSVTGSTILNYVLGQENSPFLLKSSLPNSSISRVGVTILGFDSAPNKPTSLLIQTDSLEISNSLDFSGQITNTGNDDATNDANAATVPTGNRGRNDRTISSPHAGCTISLISGRTTTF